ncbi:peptidoglycan-binding protein [Pedobacter sp. AW1-32]|uniref:peptidoglycan-binding protein n=1 Tax=Pedobacter sp. AW1-32 TaxID=3383026 RepID=UPI003FEE535D
MEGKDLIPFLKKYIGRPYVFGAMAPKDDAKYAGAFDCAELISYGVFQVYRFLYGTDIHDVKKASKADAYSGYFGVDAQKLGIIISVEQAARTAGAILVRLPTGSSIGHVAASQGDGKTVEAYSTKYGVIQSKVDGRRWSYGVLLPGVQYTENAFVQTKAPIIVYRLKSPYMKDAYVGKIQKALNLSVDNIYGPKTQAAVVAFQKKNGLVPDGEIMPGGETSKALSI